MSNPKLKKTPVKRALGGVVINLIKSTKILLEIWPSNTCIKVPKAIKMMGRIIGANEMPDGGKT